MMAASRALGFGHALPEAAITLGAHHLLLRGVPRNPGLAMHAVLDKTQRQPDARPPAGAADGLAVRGSPDRLRPAPRRRVASVDDALEDERAVLEVDRDHVLRPEPAFEDQLGDRVLDLAAGSRASAAARRTPDRSPPWRARPARAS